MWITNNLRQQWGAVKLHRWRLLGATFLTAGLIPIIGELKARFYDNVDWWDSSPVTLSLVWLAAALWLGYKGFKLMRVTVWKPLVVGAIAVVLMSIPLIAIEWLDRPSRFIGLETRASEETETTGRYDENESYDPPLIRLTPLKRGVILPQEV